MFKTEEELNDYLQGKFYSIQCLECGKWYKSLGRHILKMHDLMHDDYRNKYGIPRTKGLCSVYTLQLKSQNAIELCKDPKYLANILRPHPNKRGGSKIRILAPVTINKIIKRNKDAAFSKERAVQVIDNIKQSNLRPMYYCKKHNLKFNTFRKLAKKFNLNEMWSSIYDNPNLKRNYKYLTNNEFIKKVMELKNQKCSNNAIAKSLGVSGTTIAKIINNKEQSNGST